MAAKKTAKTARYFTYAHNIEGGLENGSFVREDPDGTKAHFMNGDYMGDVTAVPATMTEVPAARARELLPKCCNR